MATTSDGLTVAVVGATGLVGREMIAVLAERGFPVKKLIPLASTRSAGSKIAFGDGEETVGVATPEAFANVDVALFSAGGAVSGELAPAAAEAGAIVIDNSSHWRMTDGVPLVVPEVNPGDAAEFGARRIIANPNCSTIQMVVALSPLHRLATLRRVVVSTYQAVSGAGNAAMEELATQVKDLFSQGEVKPECFPRQIAFNCLPHIDVFLDDGFTKEEHKMVDETRKIFHAASLEICPTCVRVPVFNGHAESIAAWFEKPLSVDAARGAFSEAPGLVVEDFPAELRYPTQVDAAGSDHTFVGRLRSLSTSAGHASSASTASSPNSGADAGVSFWCVADNLRKGAASNAVQIAELLLKDGHLAGRN